ncbi:MAG: DUF1992 domain-containing protein [Marmoricola sp.]
MDGEQPREQRDTEPDPKDAAASRILHQAQWVELQLQRAIERGDFDNLPGAGKPLPPLNDDPDWWLKSLIAREQITGVLPEALLLRQVDRTLDDDLDKLPSSERVREELESFNRRVVNARRQLLGGPPVVTPTRDVDAEVAAWRARRRGKGSS